MEKSRYQYSTNPRKEEQPLEKRKKVKQQELKTVKKMQKQKQTKSTLIVGVIFFMLFTISYRNSQINEKFTKIQGLKSQLAEIDKQNQQLEVGIQNSLNLNNIEKQAIEKLGMQKLTNNQTKYISLPKTDYIEVTTERVVIQEKNWFEKLIEKIFK